MIRQSNILKFFIILEENILHILGYVVAKDQTENI